MSIPGFPNQPKLSMPVDRYQSLVESIEDYAVLMLDPDGVIRPGTRARKRSRGMAPRKSSANISPCSTPLNRSRRVFRRGR